MNYLYILTGIALLVSAVSDSKKTIKALKIAVKKLNKIMPAFLIMLVMISIILFLVPDKMISEYIGSNNKFIGIISAALFGSITLMPGFIVYPLCGILLKKGISYMVLATFTTTLMMVGILTFPVEKSYFGTKVTIIRNSISLVIAMIIAIVIGFCFGELS